MANIHGLSIPLVLKEIGQRIQGERLNQNLTQVEVAGRAGVARRAIQRLEESGQCTLTTFVRVLWALGKSDQVDLLLPGVGPSPVQLARLQGKKRERASGRRGKE